MQDKESDSTDHPAGVRRRTVVQGAAWSVPAVLAVGTLPAFAASVPDPQNPTIIIVNTVRLVDNAGAVGSDGNVYVWGFAGSGQYGNGTYVGTNDHKIHQVNFCGDATGLAGNIYGYYALANGGTVYYWGEMNYNSPIDTTSANAAPRPVQYNGSNLTGVVGITSTEQAAAAITSAGVLYKMGRSTVYGGRNAQYGAEVITYDSADYPTVPTAVSVNGGYKVFYTKLSDGTWGYWGGTDYGAVPTTTGVGHPSSTTVQKIDALAPWFSGAGSSTANPDGATIVSIVGGIGYGAALLGNGKVLTWGLNATAVSGRTTDASGSNTGTYYLRPGYALDSSGNQLTGITSIKAGFTGAALLDSSGDLWGYGKSDSISYEGFSSAGAKILTDTAGHPLNDVTSFQMGQGFVMATRSSSPGHIWAQGYQGGSGAVLTGVAPTQITPMTDITSNPMYSTPYVQMATCIA